MPNLLRRQRLVKRNLNEVFLNKKKLRQINIENKYWIANVDVVEILMSLLKLPIKTIMHEDYMKNLLGYS